MPPISLPLPTSPNAPQELVFITRACGVAGWRPHTTSVTLQDLFAAKAWPLLAPLLLARSAVREAVESTLGLAELFIEFAGLICWLPGAKIGWHHDANRPYLSSRHISCVLYLSSAGRDFSGGAFRFRSGEPAVVEPRAGRLLVYGTGPDDEHSVEPVLSGERFALNIWLTFDRGAREDAGLLARWGPQLAPAPPAPPAPVWLHDEAYAIPGPPTADDEAGRAAGAAEGADGGETSSADNKGCDVRLWRARALAVRGEDEGGLPSPHSLARAAYACWRPEHESAGEPFEAYCDRLYGRVRSSALRWADLEELVLL